MSKKTLNLSIEESIKRRAKRIAKQRGISVSQFFEEIIIKQEEREEWTPNPGSAAEQIMNAIPQKNGYSRL